MSKTTKKRKKSYEFGVRHIAALLVAIMISFLIVHFVHEIRSLGAYGYVGVFITMLLTDATLILPSPGLAYIALLGEALPNCLLVGIVAGLGASIGELTGYLAGYSGSGIVTNTDTYRKIKNEVKRYGLWFIFFLAVIPNPLFDLGGIAAGVTGIRVEKFFIVTLAGKIIKSVIVAYIGAYFLTF